MRSRRGQLGPSWAPPQQGREPEQPASQQALEMPALCSWLRQQLERPWLQPGQPQASEERRVSAGQAVPA